MIAGSDGEIMLQVLCLARVKLTRSAIIGTASASSTNSATWAGVTASSAITFYRRSQAFATKVSNGGL